MIRAEEMGKAMTENRMVTRNSEKISWGFYHTMLMNTARR